MASETQHTLSEAIFVGDSEMAGLMRARFACAEGNVDWSQSPLGAVETWSQSLRTAIRMILGSRSPMFIWWGQDLINFYNDAAIPVLGKQHPQALGESVSNVWSGRWQSMQPFADDALNHGKPSWNEAFELIDRNGSLEEAYFTFSFSPIETDEGDVEGVFCTCTEDTQRVLGDRRLRTLRELMAETAQAKTVHEACQIITTVLANNSRDIPFALIYLLDGDQAELMSTTQVETAVSPRTIDLADVASDCWSIDSVIASGKSQVIDQLIDRIGSLPGGAWDVSPNRAIVLPLCRPGQKALGVLIAGISPYRSLDEDYRGFFELIAGQVTTAIVATSYLEGALRWLPEESSEVQARSSESQTRSFESRTRSSEVQAQSSEVQARSSENQARTVGDRTSKNQLSLFTLQTPSTRGARILLVDDNADMRDYLQWLLSQRWQVETAVNGTIALNLIQKQPPDLVLTEAMLPEVDRFQLLTALRSDSQTKSIPIILLSARVGEEAMIEGLEAGADDYLVKPFSARELIARVEIQLQMSRLRQEQSSNQFKAEFLRTVTHELQAPLASILAWARLLQSQPLDQAKVAYALSTIERNALIEAKLVKDLLDVSTMLSGSLRIKRQLVELAPLAQNVIVTLRRSAEAKQIQLLETISNQVGIVLADGDRLRQIITIVLENSIKFTPDGGQVHLRVDRFNSDVQITVSDTGIGIDPKFLPYVFDRFTQAEVPSSHSPGGVGIGLTIARYLVELHDRTIAGVSEGKGRGTTFTIRLPLKNSAPLNSDS